jgi:hypothetical protein
MKAIIIIFTIGLMIGCEPDEIDVCQCTQTISTIDNIKYDKGTLKFYNKNKETKTVPCQDERVWVENNLQYEIKCN